MPTLLRIKRSDAAGNPATLAAGELAYSGLADNGSNGGDRLYIGMGLETDGDAANHVIIGGKYFTDMLDHARGTLTASSALIVDATKKIDDFYVDDLQLNGNEVTTTTADTDLKLSANGTGKIWVTKNVEIDGDLKVDGGDITLTDAATRIAIKDNETAALTIKEGDNNYITLKTTDTAESITLHKITTINSEDANANSVSQVLRVEHATSGEPVNGIGTGIQLVTETSGANLEIGVTLEAIASSTTATEENFDFIVRTMTSGAAAAQSLKVNNTTLQIGSTATATTLTTLGASDLTINTNNGTNSGSIKINNGANGNIEVEPNGTGDILLKSNSIVTNSDANANSVSQILRVEHVTSGIPTNGIGAGIELAAETSADNSEVGVTLEAIASSTTATEEKFDFVIRTMTAGAAAAQALKVNNDTVQIGANATATKLTTQGTSDLTINTNSGTNSGSIKINNGANGNIEIEPHGTGDVWLNADQIRVGDQNSDASITTYGTGKITLSTNCGTNSGTIDIHSGENGQIEISPNGTGPVYVNANNTRFGTNNQNATLTTYGTGDLILNTNSGTNSGSITILDGVNSKIELTPNGTGKVRFNNAYDFPNADGSSGYVLTTNGSGVLSWAASSSSLTIKDDVTPTAGTDAIDLLTETLTFAAGEGIDVAVTANTLTITAELATAGANVGASNIGSAAFDSGDFSVTAGFVSIKTSGVDNSQLAHSSLTVGTTSISLGGTSTTLAGLTQVDVDQIRIDGNSISSTDTNGNITLDPNGTGSIDVSNARIINLAEPQNDSDAATKYYVDAARSGLDVKQSVRVATTEALTALYDNGTVSLGGTLTNNGTQAALEIDGVALSAGNRVLVKDQAGADAFQNGIYTVIDIGSVSTNWVLRRALDADNLNPSGEVTSGMFCFVEAGTVNSDSGFVLTTNDPISLGSTLLSFTVFSTSGTIVAGAGLSKDGYTLKVNVAADGGIEINSDNLQLKSTLAGNGLTYTTGVLAVGGTTDRITINADSIDISSSYIGQNTITTLGTIGTGVWQGTAVGATYGGTGQTGYAVGDILYAGTTTALSKRTIGTAGQVLQVTLVGSDLIPTWNHLDGGSY